MIEDKMMRRIAHQGPSKTASAPARARMKNRTIADAVIILTSNSKRFRLDAAVKSGRTLVRAMPFKACQAAHNPEVVVGDIFATANPLKSQVSRKLLSPFSNIRAVTLKLCMRWRPRAFENHSILGSRALLNSS